jgi:hypothetical protein
MMTKEDEKIRVFYSNKNSVCSECDESIYKSDFIARTKDNKYICLSCADLDHLIYLESGDAALTRRARKYSTLFAVVFSYSQARERNERQGILVEEEALKKAEEECKTDSESRAKRREQDGIRRGKADQEYVEQFAKRVRELYPSCPVGTELEIAGHACHKNSGRVGRSKAAKELDEGAVDLAVRAHVRHTETRYDNLLMMGYEKFDARNEIKDVLDGVIHQWKNVK